MDYGSKALKYNTAQGAATWMQTALYALQLIVTGTTGDGARTASGLQ